MNLSSILRDLTSVLSASRRRFERGPISNVHALADFVGSRATYVAQTSLFGYLKTRMGTQFRVYFEDSEFGRGVKLAAADISAVCIGDFSIYAADLVRREYPSINNDDRQPIDISTQQETTRLMAKYCFEQGAEVAGISNNADPAVCEIFTAAAESFANRLQLVSWAHLGDDNSSIFRYSCDYVIDHAPVIDKFRDLDRSIVTSSTLHRWSNARRQLDKRIDAKAILVQWLAEQG